MKTRYRILNIFIVILLLCSICNNAFASNKLSESFTAVTFPPTGWNAIHVQPIIGGGEWHRSTSNFKSSPACAESNGALLGDNWLMTKQFTPGTGDSLVFWVSSNYVTTALGRLEVKVSNTGNAVANFFDFVIPLHITVGALTPNTYFRHAVSLNSYAGEALYIGFRHIEVLGLIGAVRLDGIVVGGHDLDLTVLRGGHIGGGFFNTPRRDRDTITVDIRQSTTPFNLVEPKKVYQDTLGKKIINYTLSEEGSSYYIVVHHRNSIETWSRLGGEMFTGLVTYDFTTGVNKAYLNNMKIKNGFATVFTGDNLKDANKIVDANDVVAIYNDMFPLTEGSYVLTDLNWDEITDAEDIILAYNNSIVPVQVEAP